MGRALYFVNSIYKPIEGNKVQVTLFSTDSENEQKTIVIEIDGERISMSNHKGEIREGWFVYYDQNEPFLFSYGNLSPYARKQFRLFNELQDQLTQRYIDGTTAAASLPPQFCNLTGIDVTSYHVNVGHGNCSIILIQTNGVYNIWMVDCSVKDMGNGDNHTYDIQTCFNDIEKKLQLKNDDNLHIDRFFLTHTHFDHFNGMEFLIDNGYIDGNTLCYMNLYYHWASNKYLSVLNKLKNAKVKFVEPVSSNSNSIISVIHPECRLYRSNATIVNPPSQYRVVNNPVNDSSAVIVINIGGCSMVFTGDLEQKGFKAMTSAAKCSPALYASNYYAISHHGSINGHPSMPCQKLKQPKPSPLTCVTHNKRKAILMGRNGAYPGIYSHAVIAYWTGLSGVLEYAEHAPHYLELVWSSGQVALK